MTDEIKVQITGTSQSLEEAMRRAGASVKDGAAGIRAELEATKNVAVDFGSKFDLALAGAGVGVAIAGLGQLGAKLQELGSQAIEIRSMSEILGVSTIQFQGMGEAAEEAGVGQEKLFRATQQLVDVMREARGGNSEAIEKMRGLGITVDQIGDKSFNTAEMLAYLSTQLRGGATAAATMQGLVDILGGRASLAAIAFKNLGGDTREWVAAAQEANALTDEQLERLAMLGTSATQTGQYIENGLIKALFALGDAFAASSQAQQEAFGGGGTLETLSPSATANNVHRGNTGKLRIAENEQAAAAAKAASEAELKAQMDAIRLGVAAYKTGSEQRLQLLQIYAGLAKQYYGSEATAAKEANARVLEAQRQLVEEQERLRKEGNSRAARDEETRYRVWVSGMQDGLAKMRSVEAELTKIVSERQHTEEQAVDHRRAMAMLEIDSAQQEADGMAAVGLLSASQLIETQRQLEEQRYQIQLAAVNDRLALLNVESDAHLEAKAQLELIERQHMLKIRGIDIQSLTERQRSWTEMMQSIGNSMTPVLARFLNFTVGVKGMVQGMAAAVGDTMANLAARNIATMLTEAAQGKAVHIKKIYEYAHEAAAGAYSATAGIPYVGPFLAPAASAAAFGATIAFASAEGGYDIPAGVNPLVQAHAREMILPAEHADTIRRMGARAGGDAGGSDGDGGRHVTINNNITAMDSRDVARALSRSNGRAFEAGAAAFARSKGFRLA